MSDDADCFFRAKTAVEEQFSGKFRFRDNLDEIHASMDDFVPGYKKTNRRGLSRPARRDANHQRDPELAGGGRRREEGAAAG